MARLLAPRRRGIRRRRAQQHARERPAHVSDATPEADERQLRAPGRGPSRRDGVHAGASLSASDRRPRARRRADLEAQPPGEASCTSVSFARGPPPGGTWRRRGPSHGRDGSGGLDGGQPSARSTTAGRDRLPRKVPGKRGVVCAMANEASMRGVRRCLRSRSCRASGQRIARQLAVRPRGSASRGRAGAARTRHRSFGAGVEELRGVSPARPARREGE